MQDEEEEDEFGNTLGLFDGTVEDERNTSREFLIDFFY
jgi:hypothetical protein